MEIVPIRDLKDTTKIENLCKKHDEVFITKNGYGRLVVMDIDHYKKIYKELEEAKAIYEGIKQLNEGKSLPGKDVLSQLKAKYGL